MIFISLWTPTITVTRTRSAHHENVTLMTIMIVALFASRVAAFQPQLHPLQTTVTGMPKQQTAPKLPFLLMSTDDEASPSSAQLEKAWRHIRKPLIRIGNKGFAPSHINSLQNLLVQHNGAIKIKINRSSATSVPLDQYFEDLNKMYCEKEGDGGDGGLELVRTRESQNLIMVGGAGLMDRIMDGSYPPKTVVHIRPDNKPNEE
mmetsp:Transcript_6162/g.7011  ORF Transcript_6162/g.7011 Transcript_6162/m.7011 type:complete len:204 (+) Transcript_6162:58-669(+)|eukprot:CAMPEP_0194407108 /NCGR_PEP_ID=MMETSP0176-20130528/5147_1 /TAXON_ID=216777 /ORGANISM="Proboscia alata, Strain PI-D3" /LENGTH=203 /DNA_ID=CAMNT_0039206547 /DNA_START=40 /DNA_END=651 /DNA_ORIENTATION=+